MQATTTRPGGRSARVRRTVLDAALSLLDEGRTHATIPEVAARASVAPSSLYRRWGTFENLMAEALLEVSQVAIPVPDTGAVRSDLVAFAEGVAHFLASPRGAAVSRAVAALRWSDDLAEARTRFWDERFGLSSVIVQRGIDRGELAPDTDARLLLEMVVAPLHLRQLLLGEDPTTTIQRQVDLLLDGSRRTP